MSDRYNSYAFGSSVDISGNKIVIGGRSNDIGENNAGAAYIINSEAVPEPMTILSTGIALGFGALFKKKYNSN